MKGLDIVAIPPTCTSVAHRAQRLVVVAHHAPLRAALAHSLVMRVLLNPPARPCVRQAPAQAPSPSLRCASSSNESRAWTVLGARADGAA